LRPEIVTGVPAGPALGETLDMNGHIANGTPLLVALFDA
jgi:hypothetical protein